MKMIKKTVLRWIRQALAKMPPPPPPKRPQFVIAYCVCGKPHLRGLTTLYFWDAASAMRRIRKLARRHPCIYYFLMPATARAVREDEPNWQVLGN